MRVWPGSRRSGAAPRPCTAAPSGGSKVPVPLRGRAVTARRGSPGRRGGAPSPPSAPARPLLPAAPPPARSATEPAAAAGTGTGAPGAPRRPLLWCRGDGGGAPERPAARLAPPRRAAAQRAPRRRWRQPRFGLGEQQPRGLGGAKPRARRASCEHHEGESPCSGPTPLFLAVPPPPRGAAVVVRPLPGLRAAPARDSVLRSASVGRAQPIGAVVRRLLPPLLSPENPRTGVRRASGWWQSGGGELRPPSRCTARPGHRCHQRWHRVPHSTCRRGPPRANPAQALCASRARPLLCASGNCTGHPLLVSPLRDRAATVLALHVSISPACRRAPMGLAAPGP